MSPPPAIPRREGERQLVHIKPRASARGLAFALRCRGFVLSGLGLRHMNVAGLNGDFDPDGVELVGDGGDCYNTRDEPKGVERFDGGRGVLLFGRVECCSRGYGEKPGGAGVGGEGFAGGEAEVFIVPAEQL